MLRVTEWIGWQWSNATTVLDSRGEELCIIEGSPKLLEDLAYKDWQRRLVQEEVLQLTAGLEGEEAEALRKRGWWQEATAQAFRGKGMTPKARSCLR